MANRARQGAIFLGSVDLGKETPEDMRMSG